MESTMVIKVKYGETLRRFSVHILENNKLDLDIIGLKAKIYDLFNFSPDTDITLTYIDEDGDTVTLVNDDDLRDVMRQQLKFLRIDVHLRNEKNDKSHVRSNGGSTPLRSPECQHSFQHVSTCVAEALKSLPEPLPETVSQLLLDFASKAVLTNPVLAELAQSFIPLGHTNLSQGSQSSMVPETSTQNVGADSKSSKNDGFHQEAEKHSNVAKNIGVDAPAAPAPESVDLNALPTECIASQHAKDANIGFLHERVCPFSGVSVASESYVPRVANTYPVSSGNRHTTAVGSIFHKGIICDGCGTHPIIGPRFKSKVKEDYDLCTICFTKIGNEADYTRMDYPVFDWHPKMKAFNRRHSLAGHRAADALRMCKKRNKFDNCFIMDVNILDGTVMAPSTPFTKIWRLLNNGGRVWPRGTQLVWVGGNRFSDSVSVEIEVPADGLPPGKELDIAVDFTAPKLPGRYISQWMMATPSGQKFGHRVWVLIQVDASHRGSHSDSFQALDLNLPPIGSGPKGHEDVDVNPTPGTEDVFSHPPISSTTANPVKLDLDLLESETELQFPINDALLVGQNPATFANEASSSVTYPDIDCHGNPPCSTQAAPASCPIIDYSEPIPAASPPPIPPSMVYQASSQKVTTDDVVEETLLKELDEMGFKQVDLNKEVLRMTEYNLEKSVDELCGVSEWDPILEELEEMGFDDKDKNKKLLIKNNGSIKRVVMELITGDKA